MKINITMANQNLLKSIQ